MNGQRVDRRKFTDTAKSFGRINKKNYIRRNIVFLMEQLPLTFIQSSVEPDIQESFSPAFNFTKINSSNGRLAFTENKVYWLPENPMAMLDQGWVIKASEIESYGKYGITGFSIKLVDGKELRFSNVGSKMREGISEAIEALKKDDVAEAPVAAAEPEVKVEEEAPKAEAEAEAAPEAAPAVEFTPEDAKANKVMAILAYFGILLLIPLFAAKESKFARFHVNQGLILLIIGVVLYAITKVLPSLGVLVGILDLGVLVLAIIGIINAAKGQAKELPLVGKFRIIS